MTAYAARLGLFALALSLLAGCATHEQVSRQMLTLSPESMRTRQLQTKRYDTNDEKLVLQASASVLQDLGFQLDESTPDLGILTGSKKRDATDPGQVALAIMIAALGGGNMPVDSHQTIRVSLVTAPMARALEAGQARPASALTAEKIAGTCAGLAPRLQKSIGDNLAGLLPPADVQATSKRLADQTVKALAEELNQRMKQRDYGATRVRVTFQRVVVNTQGQVSRLESLEAPEMYKEFFEKLSKSVFLEANDI